MRTEGSGRGKDAGEVVEVDVVGVGARENQDAACTT